MENKYYIFHTKLIPHYKEILRIANASTYNKDDAMDITQKVYEKAWKAVQKGSYVEQGKGKAYLFTVLNTTVKDHFNSKNNKLKRNPDIFRELSHRIQNESDLTDPDSQNYRFSDDLIFTLSDNTNFAVSQLNLEERKVLYLKVVKSYKHEEISQLLNRNVNTIKSIYNRTLKKLKNNLQSQI